MSDAAGTANSPRPSFDERFAASLRGFGPVGLIAIVIIAASQLLAPLSALLVLLWTWLSRTPWSEIGYVRPRSWTLGLALGVVFGVAFKLAMKAVVMPLLGAAALNPAYHYLVGNTAAAAAIIPVMIVQAGIGEETFFRGYLFERFAKLIGESAGAKTVTVLVTSLVFGALHYSDQGFAGAEQAVITGLVFGTIFAVTGRLWMLMCAHAAYDIAAVAIIYWDLESWVAHLIFK